MVWGVQLKLLVVPKQNELEVTRHRVMHYYEYPGVR